MRDTAITPPMTPPTIAGRFLVMVVSELLLVPMVVSALVALDLAELELEVVGEDVIEVEFASKMA